MKRLSAWWVLTLLCTFSIFAQNKVITVSGRVIESDSQEPAAQATVQLLSLPDSAYAAGIASSNKGWFTLPKVKAGKYILKVSYIGFRTKFVPVQLSNNVTEKKMGNISLDPDAVMLGEAVITAEAPPVTVKADTTEYSAAAYPVPEGSMLEDLVKKIPQKLIQFFEEHKDKNYQFKFDENIDIENQKISIEAGSILAMLMLNYIANEQEKNEINNILAENEKKYEEELREKYNPDNLFKKKENKQEEKVEEQHSLMVVENKTWYKKIFEKIKNIFKKKEM